MLPILQAKKADIKSYSAEDMMKTELELLDLRAEKSAMAIKVYIFISMIF